MKTVELIVADGCAIRTRNVELCNAATHIAANDRLATEARILEAIANDDSDSIPVAWKFADPTEDARRHWILTIARNTCEGLITTHRGYAKRSTRMEAMSIDNKASSDDTSFQPAVSDDPADIVAIDETIAEVMAALGTLSERQQIAVRMKYMDGAEYDAIAAALNVSYGAARTLVSRGVENLRSVAAK